MIPVLGVPTVGEPELADMLASIDHPVADLVVVDNSRSGVGVPDLEHVDRVWHLHFPSNLGVALSWNTIIKSTPHAPWWLIVNSDVICEPGALARIAAGAGDGLWLRPRPFAPFGAFTIGEGTVARQGLFDEYYHPIYYEDTDYKQRCERAGERVRYDLPGLPDGHTGDSRAFRQESARNDQAHHRRLNETANANRRFFQSQWAFGDPAPKRGWDLNRRRELDVDGYRR